MERMALMTWPSSSFFSMGVRGLSGGVVVAGCEVGTASGKRSAARCGETGVMASGRTVRGWRAGWGDSSDILFCCEFADFFDHSGQAVAALDGDELFEADAVEEVFDVEGEDVGGVL